MSFLKSIEVTNTGQRISSIDIFRSVAIIMVMLFHFDMLLPFGDIGVDLFFVISGILVGGILIRENTEGVKTNFFRFFLQRGFKIWPSYYLFIFLGHWLKEKDMSFEANAKYIFFYQNYTGESSHLWSLSVEEHFYILLPLLFIVVQQFNKKNQLQVLPYFIYTVIAAGIFFKFASYYFTNSQDTFSATHNRIDGLAWGVLLALQISQKKIPQRSFGSFAAGMILLILSVTLSFQSIYFEKLFYHSLIPLSFYLMIKGVYYLDFSGLKGMRLLAYYSYNIFLWHDLISILVLDHWGNNFLFLILYFIISIITGVILTIAIEEPFLKLRNGLMKRYYYKEKMVK